MGGTPKSELLLRFDQIIRGLREQGVDPTPFVEAARSLRSRTPKSATIQEVAVRALETIIRHEATLDGRLVDALVEVARTYGVVLSMHPALLLAAAVGGQDNPDRADPEKSIKLDALLATILEDHTSYQDSLYSLAVLANRIGLEDTAKIAVDLLHQIAEKETQRDQGAVVDLQVRPQPPRGDDDLSWVMKTILTLTALTAMAAGVVKIGGAVKDLLASLDDLFGDGG